MANLTAGCGKMVGMAVLFLWSMIGVAQEKWELKRDDNGIRVYTRKLDNGRYKEIRVNCEINTTTQKLVNTLQDVSHQKDWSYGTKSATLLNRSGPDRLTYYAEIALPWPAANRDVVVGLSFKTDSITQALTIRAASVPGVVPEKKNLVRVPFSLAVWNVVPSEGKIAIEYTFSAHPGGELPAWLVNMAAASGPYQSFHKLKKMLER